MNIDEIRCSNKCPHETAWSRQAKQVSCILRLQNVKTRCAKTEGHDGNHLGPDDSEWNDSGMFKDGRVN